MLENSLKGQNRINWAAFQRFLGECGAASVVAAFVGFGFLLPDAFFYLVDIFKTGRICFKILFLALGEGYTGVNFYLVLLKNSFACFCH